MVDKRKNLEPDYEDVSKRPKLSPKDNIEVPEKNDEINSKISQISSTPKENESNTSKTEISELSSQGNDAVLSQEERCDKTTSKKQNLSLLESDDELEKNTTTITSPLLSSGQEPENVTVYEQSSRCVGNEVKGSSEIYSKTGDCATELNNQSSEKFGISEAVEVSHDKLIKSPHTEGSDRAIKRLREDDLNLEDCIKKSKKDACIVDSAEQSTENLDTSVGENSKSKLSAPPSTKDSDETSLHSTGYSPTESVKELQTEPTLPLIGNQTKVGKPLEADPGKTISPEIKGSEISTVANLLKTPSDKENSLEEQVNKVDKSMNALSGEANSLGKQCSEVPSDKSDNSTFIHRETDKRKRSRKKHIVNAVQKQLEFYFSRANLAKDKFIIKQFDENSFVKLTVLSNFEKIKIISDDLKLIRHAASNSPVLELSLDETKVKSLLSTLPKEDEVDCTIYVDGLSRNHTRDWVHDHFSQYGKVEYVGLPVFKDTKKSKGFAFVEFDCPASAKKALMAYGAKSYDEDFGCSGEEMIGVRPYRVEHSNEQYHFDDYMMAMIPDSSSQDWDEGCIMPYDMDEDDEDYGNESVQDLQRDPTEDPEPDSSLMRSMNSENSAVPDLCAEEVVHDLDSSSSSSSPNDDDQNNSGHQNPPIAKNIVKQNEASSGTIHISAGTVLSAADAQAAAQKKKKKKIHRKTRMKEKEKKRLLELKKKQKNHLQPVQLLVMSKREWKFKRDKYLSDQKKTLAECKRIMRQGKVPWNALSIEFDDKAERPIKHRPAKVSGTIVKITLDKPLEEKKAMIVGLKESGGSDVAFVDAVKGESVIFVRFKTADSAQTFAAESVWKKRSSLLRGDEEDKYWDKLHSAWTERIAGPKLKKKMRGKQKVTARWRKFQEKMEQQSSPASQENFDSD